MGPDPVLQALSRSNRVGGEERRAMHAAVRLGEEVEARVGWEQALKQKAEELNLYQVQLKKAQEEISGVRVEKTRDEVERATTKARSIVRKLREQRLVDIIHEEGRRVGLREDLTKRRGVDYLDRGQRLRDRGLDDYYSRTTSSH